MNPRDADHRDLKLAADGARMTCLLLVLMRVLLGALAPLRASVAPTCDDDDRSERSRLVTDSRNCKT